MSVAATSHNSNRKEIKAALNRAGLDRLDKDVLSKCKLISLIFPSISTS